MQPFNTNPVFAILHELIYCEGSASNWAAERVRREFPAPAWAPGKDFAFTGEMIFPWMFEQFRELIPLKEAAHLLAQKGTGVPSTTRRSWPATLCRWPAPSMPRTCT